MANWLVKFLFLVVAVGGILAVFYVSWFWRALIIPMVLILVWDVGRGLLGKKE